MSASKKVYSVTYGNFKGEIDLYDLIFVCDIMKSQLSRDAVALEDLCLYSEIKTKLATIERLLGLIDKFEDFINEV